MYTPSVFSAILSATTRQALQFFIWDPMRQNSWSRGKKSEGKVHPLQALRLCTGRTAIGEVEV